MALHTSLDSTAKMERTAAPGAGRRVQYLPALQTLSSATTGSTHWVEGSFRSSKWDYSSIQPVPPRMPPNHVRAHQWARKHQEETTKFKETLHHRGHRGDTLNVDSLLLDRPHAINMPVEFDEGSVLHIASMRGHSDVANLLIHRGADLNCVNHGGQTSLHTACESGRGAVAMGLLTAGADADVRDATGQTALHRAAFTGSMDALIALLDYGANAKLRDHGDLLAIHKAASMGRTEAVAVLLERFPNTVNATAANNWTPLHFAASAGHHLTCQTLLALQAEVNAADGERMQPLHRAASARWGGEATCQILVQHKANLQATDIMRCTPLHLACESACEFGNLGAVRVLLDAGASVHALEGMRRTPLHIAAEAGNAELSELLVHYGANPSARDVSKGVPSPLAVARRQGHADVAALFDASTS